MEGTWEGEAGWKGRMEEGGLLVGSRVEKEGWRRVVRMESRVKRKDEGGWFGGRSRMERKDGEGRLGGRRQGGKEGEGGWLGGRKQGGKEGGWKGWR